MARINLNQAPYYDDYDSEKEYVQLLAIPGRVAQAREFTTLQTTLRNIIKSVGDSILKNGDIVEGCQVIVTGNTVTVTAGKVYVEGIVMRVPESQVTIQGIGAETVGVKLMEIIIDETQDSTLKDPAQGYDNYNQPGCTRLKRYLTVVANDPEAATIASLVDGAVMVETYAPEYDTLSQTLARRTYDESGSYIVEGLKIRTEALNDTSYNVVVEPGKAYVLGYELRIPTARRIKVDKSMTYSKVTARNYVYSTGTQNYLLDSDPYVRSILSVNGRVSTIESQTISTHTDSVLLDNVDVVRVLRVSQGSTNYTVGSVVGDGDCYLLREGTRYYLKWNGTNKFPASGSTYQVEYEYNSNFVQGTDYELSLVSGGHYLVWLSGDHPLHDTTFTIEYEQYLARKDIVYLDRYGIIDVLEGVPAEYGFEVFPEAPLNTLVLANITNPPNGSVSATESSNAIIVDNVGLTRFTMQDIQNMLSRVQTIEYDQAVISLNTDARQTDTPNDKKGIFTDPLVDISRIDFHYNLDEGVRVDPNKPIYDMALDLACNLCYLPIRTHTHDVVYDESRSNVHKYNRLVSLATNSEQVLVSQMNATKSFLVNPYSMFPQMPEVSVTPAIDSWIEDKIIQVPRSISDSSVVNMSTRTVDNRSSYQINNSNYRSSTTTNVSTTSIGTRTEVYTKDSVIDERSVTYIRKRTLTVEGKNFPAGLDNIECYFDGIKVSLTPIEGTSAGTMAGSVRANSLGAVKATFEIPDNVLTGVREVLLRSATTVDGYITEGFSLYVAEGVARTIERTVTTVTTVLLQQVTTNTIRAVYVDPVGQTFIVDRMSIVKGIDVYFEAKPTTNTSISCEVREVNNGMITSTVYAHKSLPASSVLISSDGTVATRFNFDDPILLEENKEYAFVLRSTSDAYRVWVSELGGIDVSTGDTILKNSYMTGVMLSSSNNSTWTAHQTMDMKFRIIEDVYASNSTVFFQDIPVQEAARLYLTADSAMPQGTSVDWTYSVDGTTYKSITPYNIVLLNGIYDRVSLKATLSRSSSSNLSPLLALDTVYLTASSYENKGCYISRNITGLDAYTDIKLVVDTYKPSGTNLVFKVSKDNGETFTTLTESSSTTQNYGWKEQTYEGKVSNATQCKIFIEATSSTNYLTPAFRRLRVIMS